MTHPSRPGESRRPGRDPRHRPVLPRRHGDQRGAAPRARAVPGADAGDRAVRPLAARADRGISHRSCSATGWPAGTARRPTPTPTSAGRSSGSGPSTAPTVPIVLVGPLDGRPGRAARRRRPAGRGRVRARALDAARRAGRPPARARPSRSCTAGGTAGCRRSCRPSSPSGPPRPARASPGSPSPGGHSMLRGALRWHRFARDVVLGGDRDRTDAGRHRECHATTRSRGPRSPL